MTLCKSTEDQRSPCDKRKDWVKSTTMVRSRNPPTDRKYLVCKAADAVLVVAVIGFGFEFDDANFSNSRPVDGSKFHFAELLQRRQSEDFKLLLGADEDLEEQ